MSAVAAPATLAQNPWPGLLWYTEEQAHLFFGREAEIDDLFRFIEREPLTTLFGRSGLGKTSLLRAGVFPRLRAAGYFPVVLRLDYAAGATTPPQQVIALTEAAAAEAGIDIEKAASGPQPLTLWEYFHQVHFWGPRNDRLTPVLVFDQFEEIFTIGSRLGTDAALLEQLADLAENRIPAEVRERAEQSGERNGVDTGAPNYKIVLSLREDFVWRLDTMRPILPAIMRNRFALGPLDVARGLQIIRNAGGEWVSQDVAHDIVEAVLSSRHGEGLAAFGEIEPAYLNVMCSELFQRMVATGQPQITRDLVKSEKGGILEALYERSLAGLPASVRLFVENHLVTPSGFRATLPVEEARHEGISESELETLVDRRLLRFEDRLGTRHVELAHDLLTAVVLRSRDERQRAELRRNVFRAGVRAVARGMALIALAAIVGALGYWFAWLRPSVKYYGDFLWRNGSIQPLGPSLSKSAVSHREESYRVTRQGHWGKVIAVDAVNGLGQLVPHSRLEDSMFYNPSGYSGPSYCCLQFTYGEDGRITRETARDKMNDMVYTIVYDSAQSLAYRTVLHASILTAQAKSTTVSGSPSEQQSAAGGQSASVLGTFDVQYNARGYMDQITYNSGGGSYSYGARIVRFDLDSSGRPTGETFWKDPVTPISPDGFEGKAFRMDSTGQLIQTTYHNRQGAPVVSPEGVPPVTRWTIDRWDNTLDESYFDASGHPATWEAAGYHKIAWDRDSHGFVRAFSYFDTAGNPVVAKGTGCHTTTYDRDADGNVTSDQCFGVNGAPANRADFGFQKRTWVNDANGRTIEVRFFASSGSPFAPRDSCFGYLVDYDAGGNQVEPDVCLDASGNANDVAQLHTHAHVTHEESFAFARALQLDERIVELTPNPSTRMDLEEAALTADSFQLCLDQANSVQDSAVDSDHQIIRDAFRLACQYGKGDNAAARATAASLIARGAGISPYTWTFDGTRYYVDTSPRFRSNPAWDSLFEALQDGDGAQAVAALRQIQAQLNR